MDFNIIISIIYGAVLGIIFIWFEAKYFHN